MLQGGGTNQKLSIITALLLRVLYSVYHGSVSTMIIVIIRIRAITVTVTITITIAILAIANNSNDDNTGGELCAPPWRPRRRRSACPGYT